MNENSVVQQVLSFLDTGLLDWSWWKIGIFTLVVTHLTIMGVTLYLHRCQAHRAIEMHPALSHFFRFWLWLTTGMETKQWAAVHRKHHARCETPDDPHSPQVLGIRKVLLEGADLYRLAAADKAEVERYGHGTPDDWIERHVYTRHSALGIGIMFALNLLLFGVSGIVVWAIQMLWIPINAAGIINGIGHYWGYRNYECPDAATNISPIGIIIGGEELHNNHHSFATSARFSSKWYEFDIGWMYLRIFSALGLVKIRKVAPIPRLHEPSPNVDLQTLHAVIAHRYDLMQAYGRGLRRTWREELARLKSSGSDYVRLASEGRDAVQRIRHEQGRLSAEQREKVEEVFSGSEKLRQIVAMRDELMATWERSNMSPEQLVAHLQQWCVRAEASGVRTLQDIAVRMRRYRPVASDGSTPVTPASHGPARPGGGVGNTAAA